MILPIAADSIDITDCFKHRLMELFRLEKPTDPAELSPSALFMAVLCIRPSHCKEISQNTFRHIFSFAVGR